MTQVLIVAWVVVNLVTLVLAIAAYLDARSDQEAVRRLNGEARELASESAVRVERLRVVIQVLLLTAALPSMFWSLDSRPEAARIITTVSLLLVPLVLLYGSLRSASDRRKMTMVVAADLGVARLAERTSTRQMLLDLESQLRANTEITKEASKHADAAYHEANSVNQKIADQGIVLVQQGEAIAARDERDVKQAEVASRVEATVDDTAEKVQDIHVATVETSHE